MAQIRALQERMGYTFNNPAMLQEALTHPSACEKQGGKHNQRLEFLGDAVLELCASEQLFGLYPKFDEGQLTRRRSSIVQEASLCAAAKAWRLAEHIAMSYGEEQSGGRGKPSILADAFEAIVGAVYLDGGYENARALILRALDMSTEGAAPKDYKTLYQEMVQAKGLPTPIYQLVSENGPPHARVFVAEVVLSGHVTGRGEGASKKQAEQKAAENAMHKAKHSQ